MATEDHKAPKTTEHESTPAPAPAPAPVAAPTAAPAVSKGPRNYLVMMLLAVLLLPSGLARAYRGEQIGWTRFWVYVGATVGCFIPFLNILAGIAVLALVVWGIVDVFQLRGTTTDADGSALVTTERDGKFARGFFIYFIVSLCLTGALILFMLIFGAFIFNTVINNSNSNRPNDYYNNPYGSSDFLREFESQSR